MNTPYTREEAADLLRRLRAKALPATPKPMPKVRRVPTGEFFRARALRVVEREILDSIRHCELLEAALREAAK